MTPLNFTFLYLLVGLLALIVCRSEKDYDGFQANRETRAFAAFILAVVCAATAIGYFVKWCLS